MRRFLLTAGGMLIAFTLGTSTAHAGDPVPRTGPIFNSPVSGTAKQDAISTRIARMVTGTPKGERAALIAAGQALRSLPLDLTTSFGVRLRDAADEVMQKASSIAPGTPLKQQYTPVRQAFRASTDAVYSALHEPPPVLPGQA